MQVNVDKTKIIGGVLKSNEKWFFQSKPIEVVSYYKYLGVCFSSRLSWSFAARSLSVQSQKALSMIKVVLNRCHGLPPDIVFEIFDKTVTPILTYPLKIWGNKLFNDIENVQIKFCRYLLGLGPRTPNVVVLGECGGYPLFFVSYSKCVKYWLKLLMMENGSLPKSVYNMLYNLCESGKKNWVSMVKDILFRYGFAVAYVNQRVGDVDKFMSKFTQRVKE